MSLKNAFKKALSWAFNNNGNEVDPTRLRISDGTALYSTGLRRLIDLHEYPLVLLIAILAKDVTATVSDVQINMYRSAVPIVSILWLLAQKNFMYPKLLKEQFGKHKDLCINTKPEKSPEQELIDRADLMKDASICCGLISFLGAGMAATIASASASPTLFAVGFMSFWPEMFHSLKHFIRFQKVTNGQWTIESAPPAKKKPASEKTSLTLAPVPA